MASRLCVLAELGQSVWLDDIGRRLLDDGTIRQLIENDCLSGLTSNPVLFVEAIRGSGAYDGGIAAAARSGAPAAAIYEALAVEDIRQAADLLRPVYERTGGRDGFACLEVPRSSRGMPKARSRRPSGSGPRSTGPMS
jgi:transaldolase